MAIATPSPTPGFATPPAERRPGEPEVAAAVERLRRSFDSGVTRGAEWRLGQLRQLLRLIEDEEPRILEALHSDLGRCAHEGWIAETNVVASEIKLALRNLRGWMRPKRVRTPLAVQPSKARIYPEPLGVALIIAPWNYPFQLATLPLLGAVSAGNCALVKPSEIAPATSAVLADLLPKYLDRDCVAVVQGGVAETTVLLAQRFDHIFYTGNGSVGRIVMEAAAKHLTPVVLELGGKSPAIVDRDIDLDAAARRIVWGKFFNAGQTCVAPDYVLAHEAIEKPLLDKLAKTIRKFYGDDPQKSPDYTRIVNGRHHQRLCALLDSGKVFAGGKSDPADRYLAPTLLTDVDLESPIMSEEIFGPILPVLRVSSIDEAIELVNARPKPLALYVFTNDARRAERVIERTSSGGACVNDCLAHAYPHDLPFGGVGPSGMGAYHGKASFDAFTHWKSVLHRSCRLDASMRYPPYTEDKIKWAKRLM